MGVLTVSTTKGKTLRSLIEASKTPGGITSNGDGTYSSGGDASTRLDRQVRVVLFGDSFSDWIPSYYGGVHAFGGLSAADHAADDLNNKVSMHTLLKTSEINLIGSGGMSGQTTTQMLARSGGARSATRKAIADIIALKPDVVCMRGGSINDMSSFDVGTSDATIYAVADRHIAIVNQFLRSGLCVTSPGVFGYNGNGSLAETKLAAIRAAIVKVNSRIKESISHPNFAWITVDGVVSNAGAFVSGASTDGTHLNGYGAGLYAPLEADAVRSFYSSVGMDGTLYYDGQFDWYNGATRPTNSTVSASGSGWSGFAEQKRDDGHHVTLTCSDAGSPGVPVGTAFFRWRYKSAIAGLLAGDKFRFKARVDVFDADTGLPIPCTGYINVTFKDSSNVQYYYAYTFAQFCSDGLVDCAYPSITLDRDAADIGDQSEILIYIGLQKTGNLRIVWSPITVWTP